MNAFLRNVELRRLMEHEEHMDTTPGKALPKQDMTHETPRSEEHMAMMREANRLRMAAKRATPDREELKRRCKEMRDAGWLTGSITRELGITPHRVGHLLRGVE